MFDKFEEKCQRFGWRGQYARLSFAYHHHHARYERYVKEAGLHCQECGGEGQIVDDVIPEVGTVYGSCGFCEGTGRVTRWMRGNWLRWKKEEKHGDDYGMKEAK